MSHQTETTNIHAKLLQVEAHARRQHQQAAFLEGTAYACPSPCGASHVHTVYAHPSHSLPLLSFLSAPAAACSHGEWRAAPSRGLVRVTQYHQQQLVIEATQTENIFCIKLKQGNLSWDLAASNTGILVLSDFFAPADVSVKFNAARGARRIFIEFQPESLKRHGGWVEEGYKFFVGRRKGTTVQQSPVTGHLASLEDDETQMQESSSSTTKRGRSNSAAAVAKERQEGKRRRVISKGKRGSGRNKANNSGCEDDEEDEDKDDMSEDKCDDDRGKAKAKGKAKVGVMDSDYEEDERCHNEDLTDEYEEIDH